MAASGFASALEPNSTVHFRFDLAQALQAFDSACVGIVEGQLHLEWVFLGAELAPHLV